ncbi:MAG: Rieske (2Fe-2S) protein [Pseudomonadota bacterium]
MFEVEKQKVFFPNWAAIGFSSDVPENGYGKPITFLGQPLLMVRDREGALRVFQNVCRHRGMILVEQAGPIQRAIRCPYHSWCYELDGRLRTTPHVGGPGTNRHDNIKRENLGLIEVRSHTYLGVVFVNIDGKAAPFEEMHRDLLVRWKEFDQPIHHGGAESSFKLSGIAV